MVRRPVGVLVILSVIFVQPRAQSQTNRAPILDVHLHAMAANDFGPPPVATCAEQLIYLPRDPREPYGFDQFAACGSKLHSPMTNDDLMRRTFDLMERYNVVGVASGPIEVVRRWRAAAPGWIIPALISAGEVPLDSIRTWSADGTIRVLGELTFQYSGLAPTDSVPESYYALAEQLDLPVGVHVGLGPPGAAYIGSPKYQMSLSNPLLLENVLLRHPKLRLYVMHAGWPMLDQMIGLLYAHPQVYVDIGVIDWFIPRREFHPYLRRLVDAGFEKRIMFGSDQMIWPDALRIAIEAVESAEFLSPAQKRDIFYNNAARFLRLSEQEVARHHGR